MILNNKAVNVFKSSSINLKDDFLYKNKMQSFDLESSNSLDKDLILLYMYLLPDYQSHGIKVGMATCHMGETFWHAIKKRIAEQKHELALSEEDYEEYGYDREVVYWGVCLNTNDDNFKDHDVHRTISDRFAGLNEKEQEWFINVPTKKLIDAFLAVRNIKKERLIYKPRREQQDCIDSLHKFFDKNPIGQRFLLNCKMRFGKCFTTYKYCEEANINKVLILTFVPAVEDSWRDDLLHIKKEYDYYTDDNLKREDFTLHDKNNPYVVFLSLQNLLGKDGNSKVKEKIQKLEGIDFDLVVLDEYHFGAWNQKTQETFEEFDDKYVKRLAFLKEKGLLEYLHLKTKKTLCLSGTPFKALARGEFNEENSYTYSYFDEQENKYKNGLEEPVEEYKEFPDMKILGYNMSHLFAGLAEPLKSKDKILSKNYFSLNQFFETKKVSNHTLGDEFIYEEEIKTWLRIIKGGTIQGNNFPYSNDRLLKNSKHTLWLMPSVSACIAMTKLLEEDEYFSKYEIINLSDPSVGSGQKALNTLNRGIKASENTNKLGTIAITVNKLTIGVTVKKWFSVFVLKDLASPEQYFQAIFRIQTPLVDKKTKEILKKECFVYDFNIDRASALLLKYAKQYEFESAGKHVKLEIAKLIVKYLPIYINGDLNNPISEDVFYQLAEFGDTSNLSLSAKIRQINNTTRFMDDDLISNMLNDKECSEVIKNVFAHAKFAKTNKSTPPKTQDEEFNAKVFKAGVDAGHKHGLEDYTNYINYDDVSIQDAFENKLNKYLFDENTFKKDTIDYINFENGFKKGYEAGINAPIKKLKCGKDDGIAYANYLKKELGEDVTYTKENAKDIKNFINSHLNNIDNIPNDYQGSLYKRWYCESFKSACIDRLRPPKVINKGDNTIEDAGNVLQHILSRLFEFLYISIYRETTFKEIFDNADENLFRAAVGITKEDFKTLNKYKIFQEDVLNNYIHEFFINESLGDSLDLSNEEIKKKYRNSFDWFGFGIEKAN